MNEPAKKIKTPPTIEQVIRRKTIFSFVAWFLLGTAAISGFLYIKGRPAVDGVQGPLRKVLNANEGVFDKTLSDGHLARTYPVSAATTHVRVNGDVGMSAGFDPTSWKLQVIRGAGDTLLLGIGDIQKLPKTEIVFDFKCIEGWDQVTHWAGAKFSDFVKYYHLDAQASMKYVGMRTPDKAYYVGIDMPSALHPQTLLCYEMNGKPLPMNQGAPLRLIIPVKYGIKNIKRIGTMTFSDQRPPDYWYERGYDYYSGL